MTRVEAITSDRVSHAMGVGGNLYIWSTDRSVLVEVCESIGKSPSSIYFNKKHNCWTIRVKSKKHKQRWYG